MWSSCDGSTRNDQTKCGAASGIKTVNGKTQIDLTVNAALKKVGGVVQLSIPKYGKVAVVRTSKATNGFSVVNLACPHAGVNVKQSSGGWICASPGHGSEFALNGALKVGPANSSLLLYFLLQVCIYVFF